MKTIKKIGIILLLLIGAVWFYSGSLIGVDKEVKVYYAELKKELRANDYKPRMFVVSGRRWKLDNYLLTKFGSAASKSKHKSGQAIDIIVLDVNKDGKSNAKDVDIVHQILDKKIIQAKGGLGTYKKASNFLNRQMIHFDCRGSKARWNR